MGENGKNGNGTKIVLWIFAVIIFPTLFFIGNNVIANENKSQERDAQLAAEDKALRQELNSGLKEQMITNQQILVSLTELKAEIKSTRGHT
jgi:hypothetical protein